MSFGDKTSLKGQECQNASVGQSQAPLQQCFCVYSVRYDVERAYQALKWWVPWFDPPEAEKISYVASQNMV
jgi:hypothetical protein